ncbi:MAG: cyclase family protein, partial [Woeseiaceae bacterium]|nr:cyclase family protein [Woeseiaceae bacterium]
MHIRHLAVAALGLFAYMAVAHAEAPASSERAWWPSEWGPDDERGAANRLTPAKLREATALIREGRIYELGRDYEAGMPLFPGRHYSLTIPGSPTHGPFGENQVVGHDEMISGQIGQVGTQFDGLGHLGTRIDGEDRFYNGFRRRDFGKSDGLEQLGVENVGPIFTRGVLIDVAGYKGVDRLPVGEVITVEDLQGALEKQQTRIGEGDVVLIHTG